MHKIFITLLISIFTIYSAFAETSINFWSDKKSYDIEENIQLSIQFSTDDIKTGDKEMNISWLENFEVVWQQQSHRQKIINGKSESHIQLQLSLIARTAWDYTLWPIFIWTGTGKTASETLNISITWERLTINKKINPPQQQSTVQEEDDENIDDVDLDAHISPPLTPPLLEEEKIILWVDWAEMTDIYTDKWFLYWKIFSKKSLWFLFLSIVWITCWLFVKKHISLYLKNKKKHIITHKKIEQKIEINYSELVENLQKNFLDSPKEEFYSKTSEILRTYLDDKVKNGLSKWSLKEVEKFLHKIPDDSIENKHKIISFYKKIYFPEYNTQEDNKEDRKNIIQELDNIVVEKDFK